MLKLSKNLSLPNEAITETFGILAARGAGKSNTAAVMAEEMFDAGLPFCVVDPVGSWWGLRSNAKGTGPGLPLAIFGGPKGDVPLERNGGQLVADIVVGQRLSCVLDLRDFESEAAKKHFLLDFARRLYTKNEAPLHLFLEEADDYIPQRPMRDEAQLLRAWENIVRRGRARGLGMTMITQRSAVINKNVLTQVQTLIAMRTTGPQDRKAIEEWLKYNDQSKDILESLPELADGEAWVWSPQFLKKTVRTQFRRRRTFDSGSTPKMAAKSKTATLADIDVSALREQMAETIERAEAEDPKALKRQIAKLERQLKASGAAPTYPDLRGENAELRQAIKTRDAMIAELDGRLRKIAALAGAERQEIAAPPPVPIVRQVVPPPRAAASPKPRGNGHDTNAPKLGKGETKVLNAIAQYSDGVDRDQLFVLTGYKSSSITAYISRLRAAGWITEDWPVFATDAGIRALGDAFEPLPTGPELYEFWMSRFGDNGEGRVLRAIYEGNGIDNQQIQECSNYKSSSVTAYISRLKARRLIEKRGRQWYPNEGIV